MKHDTDQADSLYNKQNDINDWAEQLKRTGVYEAELKLIRNHADDCFGYFALHLGVSQTLDTLSSFAIQKKLYLASNDLLQETGHVLCADPLYIPLADNSCDLVVIHHLHELVDNPHTFIREATRIVRNEGALFIVGTRANLRQLLLLMYSRRKNKWQRRLLSSRRLQDWLKLMEFSEPQIYYDNLWYRLIVKRIPQAHAPLQWLTRHLPICSIYCIKANKHQKSPVMDLENSSEPLVSVLGGISPPNAQRKNS